MHSQSLMIKGGLWSALAYFVSIGSTLISTVLLSRLLSPTDLGLYFAILSTVGIAAAIGSMGLSTPITAFVAEADAGTRGSVIARGFLIAAVGATLISVLFLVGVSKAVEVATGNAEQVPWWILALLSAVLIFGALSVHSLIALTELRGSAVARSTPPSVIALSLLVVGFAGRDLDQGDALLIVLGANVVALAMAIGLIIRHVGGKRSRHSPPPISRYLAVGLPWLASSILIFAFLQSGALVVAATSSPADAAEFGIAMRVATFVTIPALIVRSVIPPFVARVWVEGDRARLDRLMRATATISGGLSALITAALIAVGKPLLSGMFGESYSAAWATMVMLSLAYTVAALTGQSGHMLALVGLERKVLYVFLATTPPALVAMVLFGRSYGPIGVGVATALAVAASNIALAMIAWRSAGVRTWCLTSWGDVKDVTRVIAQVRHVAE